MRAAVLPAAGGSFELRDIPDPEGEAIVRVRAAGINSPDVIAECTRDLLELWGSGAIRPVVGAEFPLDKVERAHELVESRCSVGKVVLVP